LPHPIRHIGHIGSLLRKRNARERFDETKTNITTCMVFQKNSIPLSINLDGNKALAHEVVDLIPGAHASTPSGGLITAYGAF
jgi:hypothetical protein